MSVSSVSSSPTHQPGPNESAVKSRRASAPDFAKLLPQGDRITHPGVMPVEIPPPGSTTPKPAGESTDPSGSRPTGRDSGRPARSRSV
jgi:hypothetical protein